MQQTHNQTVNVQPIGSATPTTLAKAAGVALRVLLNNVGPTVVFVAEVPADLTPQPSTGTFRVLPGDQPVFVLRERQSLYAVGAGLGGLISVSVSDALPLATGH